MRVAPEAAVPRFTVGYANALDWLAANDATAVGESVMEFFPGASSELIIKSVALFVVLTVPSPEMSKSPAK